MAYYPYAVEKGAIYTLLGPDGTKAVFNEPFSDNYVGMISDLSGLDSAEVRESAQDLTEADGGAHGSFYFARRPVVLTASVFGHTSIADRNSRIDLARRASMAMRGDSTLTWKPSTRVENLATNPNAELDVLGSLVVAGTGFGTGYTVTRSTTSPIAGSASYEYSFTPDATNATNMNMYADYWTNAADAARRAPVVPGRYYAMRCKMKVRTGTSPGTLSGQLAWRNDVPAYVAGSSTNSQASPVVGTTYDFVVNGVQAPAGATWAQMLMTIQGPLNTTPLAVQIDSIVITEVSGPGVAPPAYFDGGTAGYFWQGNPNASRTGDFIEMFTTLRRQQRFIESGAWVKELQIPMVSEYATMFSTGLKDLTGSPLTVDNRGNYTAYPIIEITGASVNPRVTDSNGGDFRTTGLTLAAGEKVQFDMLNHTGQFTAGARNGQSANRYIDFALTKWVSLIGGTASNTVTFTSGGGTMKVIWRDVWA